MHVFSLKSYTLTTQIITQIKYARQKFSQFVYNGHMYNAQISLLWEARFLVDVELKVMIVPQKTTPFLVYTQMTAISLCQQHLHRQRNAATCDDIYLLGRISQNS